MENAVSSLSELFNSPTAYILDAMMREATREMTAADLAKKTVLGKSTVHRYLHALQGFDLLCKGRILGSTAATYRLNMENEIVKSLFKIAGCIDDSNQSSRHRV